VSGTASSRCSSRTARCQTRLKRTRSKSSRPQWRWATLAGWQAGPGLPQAHRLSPARAQRLNEQLRDKNQLLTAKDKTLEAQARVRLMLESALEESQLCVRDMGEEIRVVRAGTMQQQVGGVV
jgi:hypothetical protein